MTPELIEQIKTNLVQIRQALPGFDQDKIIASVANRFQVTIDEVRAVNEATLQSGDEEDLFSEEAYEAFKREQAAASQIVQPDQNGEFPSPADGAIWMAVTYSIPPRLCTKFGVIRACLMDSALLASAGSRVDVSLSSARY